jgi:hypothetical protein
MNDANGSHNRSFNLSHENGGRIVKEIIDDLIESTTEDISLADTIATESIEMKNQLSGSCDLTVVCACLYLLLAVPHLEISINLQQVQLYFYWRNFKRDWYNDSF